MSSTIAPNALGFRRPDTGTVAVALAIAVGLALVAGCAAPAQPIATRGQVHQLSVPAGDYFGLAWMSTDSIVMTWTPFTAANEPSEATHLVSMGVESTSVTALPFVAADAECWRIQEERPVRLPDGRLGFVRECQPRQYQGIDYSIIWRDIVALDQSTGHQQVLVRLANTTLHDGNQNLYAFNLKPSLDAGVAYLGDRICDAAVAFDQNGIKPLEVSLNAEPSSPNLNEPFTLDCAATINARWPEWSPDGARLAVLVSTDAKGRDGFSRLDVNWDLVVADPATGTSERWLTGLKEAGGIAWSPDGKWLLVMSYDTDSSSTISLVSSTAPHEVRRISLDERVTSIAWSPDGSKVAGLADVTTEVAGVQFPAVPVLVDLSSVVAGSSN